MALDTDQIVICSYRKPSRDEGDSRSAGFIVASK